MLDCGIQKAAALIWPGSPENDLNVSMSQSSGLMRWMSVMSDHSGNTFTNGNPLTYAMEAVPWTATNPQKYSPSQSESSLITKASNGINNGAGVEDSSPTSHVSNNQVYTTSPFNRNLMSSSNSTSSAPSNQNSVSQIIALPQNFKLSNHLHVSNGTGRKYQCKMCPQIFHSKADMQLHTQVHMREAKPFKCSQCPKTFANSSYLSQHSRIHLGIKPYRCEICQRKFTQLSHLQQHLRTHTGDKPYKCRFANCSKAFSQLSNLQSHSRSHQTDKPFKCNSCYKCFTDEASLLDHIPKHKESKHLKTHICHFCGKSYTQETYLAKHMQKHSDRMEKRCSSSRVSSQSAINFWSKNSANACQSSSIECLNNLNNSHQQLQQATLSASSLAEQQQQCLQTSLSPDSHQMSSPRFDHSNRLSMPTMATVNSRNSEELSYQVIDAKNGNSAFTPLSNTGALNSANARISYFTYESFNFPNKPSSGTESKKALEHQHHQQQQQQQSSKAGHASFPNQLIALNQIRNYASMPPPPTITSNEHSISMKDE